MILEDSEKQLHTIDTHEGEVKADEFFQKEGLSEQERDIALLALKSIGKGEQDLAAGSLGSHVGMEHMEGIKPDRLKAISLAVQAWLRMKT
ncbi:MAG: hypothetical protein PHV93_04380 [Candidatus Pacebacteria bacterium]|nr:hypothetical protein [Candidatus Paceibacterota bacterium]